MKLLDWMRREGLDDDAVAEKINAGLPADEHITAAAVKKWKYGEREPPINKIVRVEEISNREVMLRDFASPPTAPADGGA